MSTPLLALWADRYEMPHDRVDAIRERVLSDPSPNLHAAWWRALFAPLRQCLQVARRVDVT